MYLKAKYTVGITTISKKVGIKYALEIPKTLMLCRLLYILIIDPFVF
jgi:hypothetical protein